MSTNELIVFLVPPEKLVNGGVMSIFSLAKETRKIKPNATVIISTYVGFPSYKKNDLFNNDEYIYNFDEIVQEYSDTKNLLIHVPELAVKKLYLKLPAYDSFLDKLDRLAINILNQNIRHMPNTEDIFRLFEFTTELSQTTAHERYSSQYIANQFLLPLKHLSVFIDPSSYKKISFTQKDNLITYSSDIHPDKVAVIKLLKESLLNYEFKEIRGLTYEEYKHITQRAKFTITFGEGLDGYFIESTFSGGIPIAVYNEDFFPEKTALTTLPTLYNSYDEMRKKIVNDIRKNDNENDFTKLNSITYNELEKIYNIDTYREKIAQFYEGSFDFLPSYDIAIDQINNFFHDFLQESRQLNRDLREASNSLQRHKETIRKREAVIDEITKSKTYKFSKKIANILGESRKINRR